MTTTYAAIILRMITTVVVVGRLDTGERRNNGARPDLYRVRDAGALRKGRTAL
jgi:hypothetical protein